MNDIQTFDEFRPDYDSVCLNCSTAPVVTMYKGEKCINDSELCGPCFFGTAKALDPEWWNDQDD